MKKDIIIYTSKTCPYCNQIKQLFKDKKIKYTEKDKEKFNQEWYRVVELTGIPVFPTINIDNEYLVPNRDFQNQQQLLNIIEYLISDDYKEENIQIRIHEKLKTINYNMGSQFTHINKVINLIEQNKKEKSK